MKKKFIFILFLVITFYNAGIVQADSLVKKDHTRGFGNCGYMLSKNVKHKYHKHMTMKERLGNGFTVCTFEGGFNNLYSFINYD